MGKKIEDWGIQQLSHGEITNSGEIQTTTGGTTRLLSFYCPGCEMNHFFTTPRWTWNGSYDKPTVSPSIVSGWDNEEHRCRCHLFVTEGKIIFLDDCTHHLKGQTIEMEDIE